MFTHFFYVPTLLFYLQVLNLTHGCLCILPVVGRTDATPAAAAPNGLRACYQQAACAGTAAYLRRLQAQLRVAAASDNANTALVRRARRYLPRVSAYRLAYLQRRRCTGRQAAAALGVAAAWAGG